MKSKRRYSREKQQENKSRGQFVDCLSRDGIGWIVNPCETDVGEDHHVSIFEDGVSTGLTFKTQLKSTRDSGSLILATQDSELSYELEVDDLHHWEAEVNTMTVLFLWDVEQHTGWWQTVPALVKALDEKGKRWRKQKSVRVHVPRKNGTDDASLQRLRRAVADRAWPLVAGRTGKLGFTLLFPRTEEGLQRHTAFQRFIDEGEPVTIEREYISAYRPPADLRRLYGPLPTPISIELRAQVSDTTLPLRIELETPEGVVSAPPVVLRRIKAGKKKLTFSSDPKVGTLEFEMVLDHEKHSVTFNWRRGRPPATPSEGVELTKFEMASLAATHMRVTRADNGKTLIDGGIPALRATYDLESLRAQNRVFEALAFIQSRCRHLGKFNMRESFTRKQLEAIAVVEQALRHGRVKQTMRITVGSGATLPRAIASDEDTAGRDGLLWIYQGAYANILDLHVPLGRIRVYAIDPADTMDRYKRALQEARRTGRDVAVRNIEVEEVFELETFDPPTALPPTG